MGLTQYVGKAGEMAVMAEFAWRGYNVATPEIDMGDDIYVVNHANGNLWRVQVKTSDATVQGGGAARYNYGVKRSAILQSTYPELTFIFVMRCANDWKFVIIPRSVLANYLDSGELGTHAGDKQGVSLKLTAAGHVMGSKEADFTHLVDNWSIWPDLIPNKETPEEVVLAEPELRAL
jgi:hypothetical protein